MVFALHNTNRDPNPEFLARLTALEGAEGARLQHYQKYENYYDGDQPDMLPTADTKRLERYTGFRANMSSVVVDALAERLVVNGFGAAGATRQLLDRLSEIWQRNRMDDDQSTVHTEAFMLGDSYILVDFDDDQGLPRLNYCPADMVSVVYEDAANRRIAYATRRWDSADLGLRRKNVYYPDRVVRFYTTADSKGQYADADWKPYTADGSSAVLDWTDKQGKPLGVAIVPFRNKAKGRAYGRSELDAVIPLQNAINKTLVDMLLVLDTQGWPQRWVRGNAPPGGWQVGPGRVWQSNHPDFQAGELASADPTGLRESLKDLIRVAAGMTRTPQHLFHIEGQFPSGEALKTAEAPLVSKAKDRQASFGNSWEDAMMLALRLDNTYGEGKWQLDRVILQTEWADPELRNDLAHSQAVSTRAPWLPLTEIWRQFGYNAEEVKRLQQEWDQEQQKKTDAGAALLDQFRTGDSQDVGGATPQNEPGGQANTRNPDR